MDWIVYWVAKSDFHSTPFFFRDSIITEQSHYGQWSLAVFLWCKLLLCVQEISLLILFLVILMQPPSQMAKNLPGFNPWDWKIPWRRIWQPTPVLLPGKSHGQRSLEDYRPWDHKESDMTEQLHFPSFYGEEYEVSLKIRNKTTI